jgi:phosphoribosylformylglycinamidine (FGAM) synthase PurS component
VIWDTIVKVGDAVTKPVIAALRRRAIRKAARAYLANPNIETAERLRKVGGKDER